MENDENNVFYYLISTKSGEVYLTYGYHDPEGETDPHSDDSSIRWLFKLARTDLLTCNAISEGINAFVELACFPDKIDRDTDNWPVAQINESGVLQFSLEGDVNTLVVSEDYYRKSENSTFIERNTFEIGRDDDGFFTIDIARRESLEDHVNYFIKIKGQSDVYAMKVVFEAIEEPAPAGEVLSGDPELGRFYLTVGAEGVTHIEVSLPHSSGGVQNADGSPFKMGERIWLEPLDGMTDLRGLEISALNNNGEIVWTASVPDGAENAGFTHLTQDGWTITNLSSESSATISQGEQWNDGIVFDSLAPNEEKLSTFEITLGETNSMVECTIGYARTGLKLTYGLVCDDGKEYVLDVVGGHGRGSFENLPAGVYRLFVRNSDYSGVPAYENPGDFPDVSFDATGVMNYRVK